jgi:neutral ceramidase
MQLQAGFARVDITPPLGCEIPGGFHKQLARSVADPLYVRACWLQTEAGAVGLTSVDCVSLEAEAVAQIRSLVAQWIETPAAVLVTATHTHSGGPTAEVLLSETDPVYVQWVARQAATALTLAAQRQQPAILRHGAGEAPGIGFNRRYIMRDGSVMTNPGYGNPDIIRPAGPVDPVVGALAFYDDTGTLLGCLINFTCHTTFMAQPAYSGDYPAWVEKRLGATTVFLSGAMGDINQCDFRGSAERQSGPSWAQKAGEQVAVAALRALATAPAQTSPTLAAITQTVTLPLRGADPEALLAAQTLLATAGEWDQPRIYARELVLLEAMLPASRQAEAEIQALQIGPLRLVGLPLQPFCDLGRQIKANCPNTLVVSMANGNLGYVGPAQAYAEGGYELTLKRGARLAPGAGELLVEAATQTLLQL